MQHARLMAALLVAVVALALYTAVTRMSEGPPQAADAGSDQDAREDSGPEDASLDAASFDTFDPATSAAELAFSPDWVGAPCGHDAECPFEGGFCLLPEEGFPRGYCTRQCRKLCPDRRGDLYASTFCMEDPSYGSEGLCVAQCNLHLTTSGCRPGYVCSTVSRLNDITVRLVCLPQRGTPAPPTDCTATLAETGILHTRPDLADSLSRPARPGDPRPVQEVCQIDTPILLASPVHGVDFRLRGKKHAEHILVACEMALVTERLAKVLAEAGVVEVEHRGTYSCRGVRRSNSLSGHGHALAIDISGFERAQGSPLDIERDWFGNDQEKRRFLRDLTARIKATKLFDLVLTPESNRDHADHLHLEVK